MIGAVGLGWLDHLRFSAARCCEWHEVSRILKMIKKAVKEQHISSDEDERI